MEGILETSAKFAQSQLFNVQLMSSTVQEGNFASAIQESTSTSQLDTLLQNMRGIFLAFFFTSEKKL